MSSPVVNFNMAVVLAFAILVASVALAVLGARRAWRHPRPGRLVLAAVLLAFAGFNGWRFHFELTYFDEIDFHPQFGKAEVVGVWHRGGEFLDLRPDGSFVASGSKPGSWSIREQDMPPHLAVGETTWVVFARAGALHIFPVGAHNADPDEWNLLNVYKREPEARARGDLR